MHHVFDETPNEAAPALNESLATTTVSHASYSDHVGRIMHVDAKEQVDTSQYRQRGYRVGSLMTGPDDPDSYYLQPGHPLHKKVEKGGRFKVATILNHLMNGIIYILRIVRLSTMLTSENEAASEAQLSKL